MLDFVSAGVQVLDAWLLRRQADKWLKLIVTIGFSYWTTFSFACGTALTAKASVGMAVGIGMIHAAGVSLFLFARSPLTKDLQIAVPKQMNVESGQEDSMIVKGGK